MINEIHVRALMSDDLDEVALMETQVLLEQVRNRRLPTCDLCLPEGSNRYLFLKKYGLPKYVVTKRREIMRDDFETNGHYMFVAEDNERIVGKGGLKIYAGQQRAALYGFNILSEFQGRDVGLRLLKFGLQEIDSHPEIKTISVGRYELTEKKQPILRRIAKMVNLARPETVGIESAVWKGFKVHYYHFPKDVVTELVDELGDKFSRLF